MGCDCSRCVSHFCLALLFGPFNGSWWKKSSVVSHTAPVPGIPSQPQVLSQANCDPTFFSFSFWWLSSFGSHKIWYQSFAVVFFSFSFFFVCCLCGCVYWNMCS